MKATKGFRKDMTCRGFRYEEGKSYHEEKAKYRKTGFHACEYPLDCFTHYGPTESEYHEVELSGDIDKSTLDTNMSATDIKIGPKLSFTELALSAYDFIYKKAKEVSVYKGASRVESVISNHNVVSKGGYGCVASNTRSYGAAAVYGPESSASVTESFSTSIADGSSATSTATSYNSIASATGYDSISAVTGKNSVSSTEGMHSISGTTGCYSVSSATGNHSVSVTTEEESVSSANGYGCVSTTTGRDSFASVESDTGIAVAWGYKSKAKGCIGSRLVLADWKCVRYTLNEEDAWQLVGAKMVIVDGVNIKADTYYRCINGEVVEAIDEDE